MVIPQEAACSRILFVATFVFPCTSNRRILLGRKIVSKTNNAMPNINTGLCVILLIFLNGPRTSTDLKYAPYFLAITASLLYCLQLTITDADKESRQFSSYKAIPCSAAFDRKPVISLQIICMRTLSKRVR